MDDVDEALAEIMAHPHFCQYSRAQLLTCDVFSDAPEWDVPVESVEEVEPPYRSQSFDDRFPVRGQIPDRLWEAFTSRPAAQVDALIEGWWGPQAPEPHDLFLALEWHRAGHIGIPRTAGYDDAVAEFVFDQCSPDADGGRPSHGVEAPFGAGVLPRADVLGALEHGMSRGWDKEAMESYEDLRERIATVA